MLKPSTSGRRQPVAVIILAILILSITSACKQNKEERMHTHTNHLINQTSPYLLQHAHNPVDWYPWGEEALAKARKENKPIFLSIGYASCHWCHVMESESFENEEIANLMNTLFVNIKVDREERPDLDQKYMRFVQMTTGSGGWPLTVFLTPEGEPFYGGTYFPPEDRYGKPGLKKLLPVVADFYHNNKTELQANLEKIRTMLRRYDAETQGQTIPGKENWTTAVEQLERYYDPENGGMGQAPKFPAAQVFSLFLRHYAHSQDTHYLQMVEHTLQRMARGGIYDQLGGGFARYSVDAHWMVPHFEKMLYDNAQLVNLYLDAYQVTKNLFYLNIANETLAFVQRELTDENGGFYSSLDADSEGKEGRFYLWQKDEILNILGPQNGEIICARFGVTQGGNFEGRNILFVNRSYEQLAKQFHKSNKEIERIVDEGKKLLFRQRTQRVHPGLDYKILTSWNGLMLSAFARAFQITGNEAYRKIIRKNIRFIKDHLYVNNRLLHVHSKGQSSVPAFVDDYAYLIQGLLDSFEAVSDPAYLQWSRELTNETNALFWDQKNGGYFYTAANSKSSDEPRIKNEQDTSLPSASAVMAMNQLRLFYFTDQNTLLNRAEVLLKKYGQEALNNPYGFATYLQALDFYLWQPVEVVILQRDSEIFSQMRKVVFERYLPNKVIIVSREGKASPEVGRSILQGRTAIEGKTTAYLCRGQTCSLPATRPEQLARLLE